MPFHFVNQPYSSGYALRDYFREMLVTDCDELDIVTAWVKRSGVAAIEPALRSLRSRGVRMRAIVGISLGGTSRQGLETLLHNVDELFVYQHPGRTFHPKIYRAANSTAALTLVGSHNLTAGGVANNFEAGTLGRLDLSIDTEFNYHSDLHGYVDRLATDASARRVDLAFIKDLLTSDRYLLPDESARLATGDETGTKPRPVDPALFGRSDDALTTFLPPRAAHVDGLPSSAAHVRSEAEANDAAAALEVEVEIDKTTPENVVERRWYKRLGRIDAQQGTSANWNPSNTATLVQAGHPIRRETYFRDNLFVDLDWTTAMSRGGKDREIAALIAEVITDDESLGKYQLEIRHTPDYNSDQDNRTTELQWGELSTHMQTTNHVDDYLTLERLSDGSFRLHLTATTVGPFM